MVTKVTRYSRRGRVQELASRYRKRARRALEAVARSAILCNTAEAVDAAAALAHMVSMQGVGPRTCLLFLSFLATNNPAVVDALIGDRNPFLLFSAVRPNWYLIRETFRILATHKSNELYEKCLLALLGVVQSAYKTSKFGYRLYPLTVADVYSLGKYLDKGLGQDQERNRLLLDILFDIYHVAINGEDRATVQVGIKANEIRMAFFDNTKRMSDAIPHVLLIRDRPPRQPAPVHYRLRGADSSSPPGAPAAAAQATEALNAPAAAPWASEPPEARGEAPVARARKTRSPRETQKPQTGRSRHGAKRKRL